MRLKLWMGVFCAAGLFGCVTPNNVGNLNHRVTQLELNNEALASALQRSEAQLSAISSQIGDQPMAGNDKYAQLNAAVEELRREIQLVKGKMEETDYAIQKGRLGDSAQEPESRLAQIEEICRLNQERILQIEQHLNLKHGVPAPNAAVDAPPKKAPATADTLSEAELYDTAKQALDGGEFEASRIKFIEFVKRFPKSGNADNAQFWIGETYYREKWYEKAIMEYQKVIENYPDGNKVPSALLKQGLSFFNLNETSNARLILKEIIKKYPTSNEAKIAKEKLATFN